MYVPRQFEREGGPHREPRGDDPRTRGAESNWSDDDIRDLVRWSRPALADVGGAELSTLWHRLGRDNVQLSLVGTRAVLAIVFDDKTSLGIVRLYASQVAAKLGSLFDEVDFDS